MIFNSLARKGFAVFIDKSLDPHESRGAPHFAARTPQKNSLRSFSTGQTVFGEWSLPRSEPTGSATGAAS